MGVIAPPSWAYFAPLLPLGQLGIQTHPHCNFLPQNNPQNRREPRQKPAAQSPFSAGPALGSAVYRRKTSPNGPHIPCPHRLGRALQLPSYNQPSKPARTASKPTAQRPFSGAPAAGFGLDSDHFCASFESIWITKDLGFGLISSRAFQRCTGLVLNRKNQIFINFLTPEGRAQKQGRALA